MLWMATVDTLVLVASSALTAIALTARAVCTLTVEGAATAGERGRPAVNVVDWVTEACCKQKQEKCRMS